MTHEERLALIHRPFLIRNVGPSYLHGGTAVADTFGELAEDDDDSLRGWAPRSHPSAGASDAHIIKAKSNTISFSTRQSYNTITREHGLYASRKGHK